MGRYKRGCSRKKTERHKKIQVVRTDGKCRVDRCNKDQEKRPTVAGNENLRNELPIESLNTSESDYHEFSEGVDLESSRLSKNPVTDATNNINEVSANCNQNVDDNRINSPSTISSTVAEAMEIISTGSTTVWTVTPTSRNQNSGRDFVDHYPDSPKSSKFFDKASSNETKPENEGLTDSDEDSNDGLIHSHSPLPFLQKMGLEETDKASERIKIGKCIVDVDHFIESLKELCNHKTLSNCNLSHMEPIKKFRKGLLVSIKLQCRMCNLKKVIWTNKEEKMDINETAAFGILATGNGFSQAEELFAAMNMKFMRFETYKKKEKKIAKGIEEACLDEILKAGAEEKRLAEADGHFMADGKPWTSVITDGSWKKRSYRTKYDSASGMAAIISLRTGKVLFLGIRNKFCSICTYHESKSSSAPKHKCMKNYSGSSTGMESDVIVDGFRQSLSMHGLVYKKMIGDGDSSVYSKVSENAPYGPSVRIEKIECKNHVLRNYGSKLRAVCTDRTEGTVALRALLQKNLLRLRVAVVCAMKYWQQQDVPLHKKITSLRDDIINGPSHVFGSHDRCASYFCKYSPKNDCQMEKDFNFVPKLDECKMFEKIQSAANNVAEKASSLIHNVTNNIVECLNSLVAKLIGGKRINWKDTYNTRCEAAVISFNTKGELLRKVHKTVTSESPGSVTKRYIKNKVKKMNYNAKRKASGKSCRKKLEFYGPDSDYGPEAGTVRPDITELELEKKIKEHLEKLPNTAEQRKTISETTIGQSSNPEWLDIRRTMLTASNFGKICKMRETTSCSGLVKDLLYSTFTGNKATNYGNSKEPIAKQRLEKSLKLKIVESGLVIDEELPYLGASPDGLISDDRCVEIKCPYSAKDMTPEEAIASGKLKFCTFENGKLHLKRSHNYYFQVQGQLNICQKKTCIFVLWTPHGFIYEEIARDEKLWEEMKPKLTRFYVSCLLPELLDSRTERGLSIRDPDFILEAKKKAAEKKLIREANKQKADEEKMNKEAATKRKRVVEKKEKPETRKRKPAAVEKEKRTEVTGKQKRVVEQKEKPETRKRKPAAVEEEKTTEVAEKQKRVVEQKEKPETRKRKPAAFEEEKTTEVAEKQKRVVEQKEKPETRKRKPAAIEEEKTTEVAEKQIRVVEQKEKPETRKRKSAALEEEKRTEVAGKQKRVVEQKEKPETRKRKSAAIEEEKRIEVAGKPKRVVEEKKNLKKKRKTS